MAAGQIEVNGFLLEVGLEAPVPSGSAASPALSTAGLVKAKKCSSEEKPLKKLKLQPGAREDTPVHRADTVLAPKAAHTGTGLQSHIVPTQHSFSASGDSEEQQMEKEMGCQKEDPLLQTVRLQIFSSS